MRKQHNQLKTLLQQKSLVKVIAGIDNFDLDHIGQIVHSASVAGAGAVDVAARPDIVRLARQSTDLPVFASSVNPQDLAMAVALGADVAEIGNFDALYKDGFYLSAEDVMDLTQKTQALLPKEAMICVTIPGHLTSDVQMLLAKRLASIGVDLLQTEGASRVVSMTKEVKLLSDKDKLKLTLENTRFLSQTVSLPIMTASGIDATNVEEAFLAGASAVGVGKAVNRFHSEEEMIETLMALMANVSAISTEVPMALAS